MNRTGISNVRLEVNRSYVEWVNIDEVVPNPLNPRKNDAVKSEEITRIIKKRGWEIPLTVYKKGSIYVLLSGHRRLFAARQNGLKQVPVYVVEAPKTHQEEIERIASAQSGQEDWDVWEWSKFTYERWISWGKPSFKTFANELNMSKGTVESYCLTLDYFPANEIEAGIKNKTFPVTVLSEIILWIKDIKKFHPSVIEKMSEDLIRRAFLTKVEKKKVARDTLRKREFLKVVDEKDLWEFFTQPELSLQELMIRKEFNVKEKSFQGKLISVGLAKTNVKKMLPKTKDEAKKAAKALAELQESISLQLKEIEKYYPGVIEKEDLFTWANINKKKNTATKIKKGR